MYVGEGGTRGRTTKYEECPPLLPVRLYLSPVFIRRHFRWNNKNKDSGEKDREICRGLYGW